MSGALFLPCPGAARREGSSQRLSGRQASTQVVVPPLQESVLTGEAGHPDGERSCPCAGTSPGSPRACGARVAAGWGPPWGALTDPQPHMPWQGPPASPPALASCSGPLGWCPRGHPPRHPRIPLDAPGERTRFSFSPPRSVPPAHAELGPFPPPGSAVTAALCSSPQKVSCLRPGLQQRVGPQRGERGVRPRPTQRRFHQIMRGGPAPSDPLPGTPGRDCQGRGAAGKRLSPRLTPVFGVLGRSRTLPPPDISQMGIAR